MARRVAICVESRCDSFLALRLSLLLHMHVSVYDVPFQQRRKKKTRYVRRAIKKCFSEIATSAFCTRSPEITKKRKLNLAKSEDFSQEKTHTVDVIRVRPV